jgi:hypothetical protein
MKRGWNTKFVNMSRYDIDTDSYRDNHVYSKNTIVQKVCRNNDCPIVSKLLDKF